MMALASYMKAPLRSNAPPSLGGLHSVGRGVALVEDVLKAFRVVRPVRDRIWACSEAGRRRPLEKVRRAMALRRACDHLERRKNRLLNSFGSGGSVNLHAPEFITGSN